MIGNGVGIDRVVRCRRLHLRNWGGERSPCPICSVNPKFSAASGFEVVTRFQPARPPLIWSSDAKRRAIMKAGSKVVEAVNAAATVPISIGTA